MKCNLIKTVQQEWLSLKKYFIKIKWYFLVELVFLLMVYGQWFFNIDLSIDTEALINVPNYSLNWLEIGRYGGIFTKILFQLTWFNPFVASIFSLFMLLLSSCIIGYIFWRIGEISIGLSVIFGILYYTYPIMVEQFYFDLQIFEVSWAFILVALSVYVVFLGTQKYLILNSVFAIVCLIWAISTYQIFAIIYIALVVSCYLLICQKNISDLVNIEKSRYFKKFSLNIIKQSLIIFLLSFFINEGIIQIFFLKSNYLGDQILWNLGLISQCFENIYMHIFYGFIGKGVFYTIFYSLTAIGVFFCILIDIRSSKDRVLNILFILSGVILQLCPFLLTVYMGSIPAIRAQMVYPLVLSFNVLYISNYFLRRNLLKVGVIILISLIFWSQNLTTGRLIYTDLIRNQEDIRLMENIEDRINLVSSINKPIAFVGEYENKLNNACIRGEIIGMSVFNLNCNVKPYYYVSSARIANFAQTLGYSFQSVNEEQMVEAYQYAKDMPIWPNRDSFKEKEDYIIIKLGEIQW